MDMFSFYSNHWYVSFRVSFFTTGDVKRYEVNVSNWKTIERDYQCCSSNEVFVYRFSNKDIEVSTLCALHLIE